jgi:hypothetical protein
MGSSLMLCRVSVAKSALFCAVFCRSLVCIFIFCYFLPLDCLSFFGLLFLVTPFGIFNFSYICLFIQRENIITYGRKRCYTWITYSFLFFFNSNIHFSMHSELSCTIWKCAICLVYCFCLLMFLFVWVLFVVFWFVCLFIFCWLYDKNVL